MDFLQRNISVVCLAGAGGALGFLYQYNRSRIITEPVTSKILDYAVTVTKDIVSPFIPVLKDFLPPKEYAQKTLEDHLDDTCDTARTFILSVTSQAKTFLSSVTSKSMSKISTRDRLLVVFSAAGFIYVYATVSSFAKSNRRSSTNPVKLLFKYCEFHCKRVTRVFQDNDGVAMCLYISLLFAFMKVNSEHVDFNMAPPLKLSDVLTIS